MYIEDLAINENFLSKYHIDEIYNVFVKYCSLEENRFTAERYKALTKNFYNQHGMIQKFEEGKILEKYSLIDIDRDLTVDFQDFLKFIILNLKFLSGDLSKNKKLEKLNMLLTDNDIFIFNNIIKEIVFPLETINPFLLTEKSHYLFPKFIFYFNYLYNKLGELKIINPRKKIEFFSNNFHKIFVKENINTLNILLCIEDGNNNFSGVTELNDIIKCLDLLQNHFEIKFYFLEIFNFLNILMNSNILENLINLIFKYNVESNSKFFTRILKIFRRLYATLIKMDDLIEIYKEYDIWLNNINIADNFYELFMKFENIYVSKIIRNFDFLKNKANNYYYLNQIILFGLEFSKRSKENLILFFENYNYLEIMYANINYLVNSDNYNFKLQFNKDIIGSQNLNNENIFNDIENNNSNINLDENTQNYLDINTLVNGKASDPKYLINSNTINAINKNSENFHFYQIRKILLFCIKLSQIILSKKRINIEKIDSDLEMPVIKLKYILEITSRFFNNTNDRIIEEYVFVLKSLISNEDINLDLEFLNSSVYKIVNNPNMFYFYNLTLKSILRKAKNSMQISSIINAKYINILTEFIFYDVQDSEFFENFIENKNFSNLRILNIGLFKDFVELFYILECLILQNGQIKNQIIINFSNFAFDIFEVILNNDTIINSKYTKQIDKSKLHNLQKRQDGIFLLNNPIIKIILELIQLLLQNEKDFTSMILLRKNFVNFFCCNIDLFVLNDNIFYKDILKNEVNLKNENYDLLIIQKILFLINTLIDSDYVQIKPEFFIKFFNFDFLTIMKQIFDFFYNIYKSKNNKEINFNWIIFYKFYQIIENDKFSSFLHQIFTIIFRLLTIFDEFIFFLYIKKTNPNYNFDTSQIEYFNQESLKNKKYLINYSIFGISLKEKNLEIISNIENLNSTQNACHQKINTSDGESDINYLNIEKIIKQNINANFNEIFLSRYVLQNYNFHEVCLFCEGIYIELDTKIIEIFGENTLLKNSKQNVKTKSDLITTRSIFKQNLINLPCNSAIRNIKLYLQTPEEVFEGKAQILKIDDILNLSFLKLKNEIKNIYKEEYDIFYFSQLKNLKIQINSTDDFISAFREEKENKLTANINNDSTNINMANSMHFPFQTNNLKNTTYLSISDKENLTTNLNMIYNLNSQSSSGIFEMKFYLEKSSRNMQKEGNLTVCPYCRLQHKISNEVYKKFDETNSNYYLMCRKCREITFLKFINLLTNINSNMILEQEIFKVFPNFLNPNGHNLLNVTGNPNPNLINSNLDISCNFPNINLDSNLSRQNLNSNRPNFVENISASKNGLFSNQNLKNTFLSDNFNTVHQNNFQNKGSNIFSSIGKNNIQNFVETNFPNSNYSSINNNNLINNLNNINSNAVSNSINFTTPNNNLLNSISRNNIIPKTGSNQNQINNLLNTSIKNSNLQNISKLNTDFNIINTSKNKSPYKEDHLPNIEILLNKDSNNNQKYNISQSEMNKNVNFDNKNGQTKINNESIRVNNISEFNLGNQKPRDSNNFN